MEGPPIGSRRRKIWEEQQKAKLERQKREALTEEENRKALGASAAVFAKMLERGQLSKEIVIKLSKKKV